MTLTELLKKATPLLWSVRGPAPDNLLLVGADKATVVCEMWTDHNNGWGPLDVEAVNNLELIQHAVNLLPELVAALQSLLESHRISQPPPRNYNQHYDAQRAAMAVLAKAETVAP